jgi:ABC-type nitrate/sulfonate/bicarbonate transport system permease component
MRGVDRPERAAPIAVGIGLCGGWHWAVATGRVSPIVLPPPLEVAVALHESRAALLVDASVTAATAGTGLALGSLVGFALAFGMLRSRLVRAVSVPYVVGLRIAPVIAIAPLVFLWLGRGVGSRAVVVATLTQFPVVVGTLSGLRSVPEEYLDLVRSVGASDRRLFRSVRLPAAAASVSASLRIAATLAVIGTVVTEFVTLRSGLGTRIYETGLRLETAETYAALVVLAFVGVGFYRLPRLCGWLWHRYGAWTSRRGGGVSPR